MGDVTFEVLKNVTRVNQQDKLASVRACVPEDCTLVCVSLPSCVLAIFHVSSKTCDLYTGVRGCGPTDYVKRTTISLITECVYRHTQIGAKRMYLCFCSQMHTFSSFHKLTLRI